MDKGVGVDPQAAGRVEGTVGRTRRNFYLTIRVSKNGLVKGRFSPEGGGLRVDGARSPQNTRGVIVKTEH